MGRSGDSQACSSTKSTDAKSQLLRPRKSIKVEGCLFSPQNTRNSNVQRQADQDSKLVGPQRSNVDLIDLFLTTTMKASAANVRCSIAVAFFQLLFFFLGREPKLPIRDIAMRRKAAEETNVTWAQVRTFRVRVTRNRASTQVRFSRDTRCTLQGKPILQHRGRRQGRLGTGRMVGDGEYYGIGEGGKSELWSRLVLAVVVK